MGEAFLHIPRSVSQCGAAGWRAVEDRRCGASAGLVSCSPCQGGEGSCWHTWSSTLSSSMGFTTFSATIARTVSPATYSALSHCTCRPVAADQPAPMMPRRGAGLGECGQLERRRLPGGACRERPAEGGAGPGQQRNDSRDLSNVGCCGRQACASTAPGQRIPGGQEVCTAGLDPNRLGL